jgi:Prophage tail length tape measure protein
MWSPRQGGSAANDNSRQATQQLAFQMGDLGTQLASGTSLPQAFGQQIGQTTQAVALFGNGSGKVAAFLREPWGVALSFAAIAGAPFLAWLFKSEERRGRRARTGAPLLDY